MCPRHGTKFHADREINIGHEDKPRPTYISTKSNPEYKPELVNSLEVVLLNEMFSLDQSIV